MHEKQYRQQAFHACSKAMLLYTSALKEFNTKLEILSNEFKLAYKYNPIEHMYRYWNPSLSYNFLAP